MFYAISLVGETQLVSFLLRFASLDPCSNGIVGAIAVSPQNRDAVAQLGDSA
jgi:hypothetical protein